MEQFTRRETVVLTRTSSSCLNYLARTGLVVPVCLQHNRGSRLYYSWEQILQLRTIRQLRRKTSLQMIRKILTFFESQAGDRSLYNKHLLVNEDNISWIHRGELAADSLPQVVQVAARSNQHIGQLALTLAPAMAHSGKTVALSSQSNVVDFKHPRRYV